MEEEKDLTPKQKKFCEEYIFDYNGSRSARDAGYSEDTAASIASENLTKPNIQAYIKELESDLAKTLGITKSRVLKEHSKLAFSSIAHMHNTWITRKEFEELTDDQKAAIQEISTQTRTERINKGTKDEEVMNIDFVKIKLYDKQRALDSITKMLGFDPAQQVVNKNINYNSEMTKDEIKGIADALDADV